jgi:hypothetical protein
MCLFLLFHRSVFGIQLADQTVTEVLVNLVGVINRLLLNYLTNFIHMLLR